MIINIPCVNTYDSIYRSFISGQKHTMVSLYLFSQSEFLNIAKMNM